MSSASPSPASSPGMALIGCGGSSGSHLLGALLNNCHHLKAGPEICFMHPAELYEPGTFHEALTSYLAGKGKALSYQIDRQRSFGIHPAFIYLNRAFYGVEADDLIAGAKSLREAIGMIRDALCRNRQWPEGFLWVEHSPQNCIAAALFLDTFPDGFFIHLVRDGRDAVLSQYKRFRDEGFPGIPDHKAFELALSQWCYLETKALEAAGKKNYLKIHYEDLVTRPLAVMNAILARLALPVFAEEDWQRKSKTTADDFQLRQGKKARSWHCSPFEQISDKAIGAWRREFAPSFWEEIINVPVTISGMSQDIHLGEILQTHGYLP